MAVRRSSEQRDRDFHECLYFPVWQGDLRGTEGHVIKGD